MHINLRRYPTTHAQRLERWLGTEQFNLLTTTDSYSPIPVANVPGRVYMLHGEPVGLLQAGGFTGVADVYLDTLKRRWKRAARSRQLNTGFSSLSDLISEATSGGKRQDFPFTKIGVTGVAAVANTLWYEGNVPAAGGNPAALAAGTLLDNTTTGGLLQTDPAGSDTLHFVTATVNSSQATMMLLMTDMIWQGAPSMVVTTAQTVTINSGLLLPRYNGSTGSATGNYITVFVRTVLGATAHNHTFQYVDQAGNAAENGAALAGVSSGIAKRADHANWFYPLNAGDTGFRDITQYTQSANPTGQVDIHAHHPLVWIPCPVANAPVIIDGINSAFNLVQILVDACLSFIEVNKGATTATTYTGQVTLVSG